VWSWSPSCGLDVIRPSLVAMIVCEVKKTGGGCRPPPRLRLLCEIQCARLFRGGILKSHRRQKLTDREAFFQPRRPESEMIKRRRPVRCIELSADKGPLRSCEIGDFAPRRSGW